MHRILNRVLCTLAALAFCATSASAALSSYAKVVAAGSFMTADSWTNLFVGSAAIRNSSSVTNTATGFNLPFSFKLDGTVYTRLSVSTNGLISFGSGNVAVTGSNSLTTTSTTQGQFPRIAAWWDQMYITGGARNYCSNRAPAIRWGVTGVAPNRVVIVDFRDIEVSSRSVAYSSWQVRIFESSNMIEFFYTDMNSLSCKNTSSRYSTSASIGIAMSSSNFISATPSTATASFSTSSVNNSINLNTTSHRIPPGTIYRFAPCNISLSGNTSEGGAPNMLAGDTLMATTTVQRGNVGTFQPFTINGSIAGCSTGSYALSITGPNAGDYALNATSSSIAPGATVTPVITFTPSAIGVRRATLTVSDNNGFVRSFPLAATGLTRSEWTGNLDQGGTPTLASGDSLMSAIEVRRLQSGSYTPISIRNINVNPSASPMVVSLAIDSAGALSYQYSISGPSLIALGPGQSFTPTIVFDAMSVARQTARLTVNVDGEVRVFTLSATSMAPGMEVTASGGVVSAAKPLFSNVQSCVGEQLTAIPVTITNNGTMPLDVREMAFYLTDTTDRQGTPMLPLLRTPQGAVTPLRDYVLSDMPGSVPLASTAGVTTPFTLQAGAARTLYLTFAGHIPGKRFARVFIRTNAENVVGQDTNAFDNIAIAPTQTGGLFTTDLLARGLGSRVASSIAGTPFSPLVFASTEVGDTSEAAFAIANTGACDLRINRNRLRIVSGDVNEIRLVSALRNAGFDQATGDYLLAPGAVDTIRLRFVPSRSGTRMATLLIQTNDSTIARPGLSERGSLYLDLSGRGLAALQGDELVLDPVVIGSSVAGVAVLENALNVPVSIASISFEGDDAAQFGEDAAAAWPARPFVVLAGEKLRLGVRLTPTGDVGQRRATLVLVTTGGDTVRVPIRGEAGTQTLVVSASSLFEDVTVAVGQTVRKPVIISNTGTLPVRISSVALAGPDAASYRLGLMPRMDLEAGQAEFLEVTYAPTTPGQTSATLVITAAGGQTYSVTLGGTALRIRRDPVDPVTTVARTDHGTPQLQAGTRPDLELR
jgi:hypothetical protein